MKRETEQNINTIRHITEAIINCIPNREHVRILKEP
jgi:hypothetical protein